MNEPRGSLPIEVQQGMRIVNRHVTEAMATTQLTIEMGVDDLDQQQLRQQLTELYRASMHIHILSGSAIVRISGVLNVTSQEAFTVRASQIGDDELSSALGMPVTVIPWGMDFINSSVPKDEPCAKGYYCSAGAAYACPKATWSNKTSQQDSSTCRACPSPGRMTTQSEGTSSIDGCICQEQYYKAAYGGCLACPVGSMCPEAGVVLAALSITVGESAPAHSLPRSHS